MPQKCITSGASNPLFYCILVYVHIRYVYLKRKYFSFTGFSVLFLSSLWFGVRPIFLSLPPPLSTLLPKLSFTLEELSNPCFPFLYPSSIFISFNPSAIYLSHHFYFHFSIQSTLLPRQPLPRYEIVWDFLLSQQQQQIVWCCIIT